MPEIKIKDKQQYLEDNYPFIPIPKLTDKMICIHCDSEIVVGDYKVFTNSKGMEFICCPNAPECNGTVID
ncbi:MAG: hypothetical protein PHU62_07340 [Bacteroidales bacterium]|jgi:hypothetical protein|nr:hypothetical protein [Bacteroidales bacterium]MDD3152003.1 hypothetical protein [Bacteroidales bacterium]MDD3914304.1 hypothetical protein [Bacteroidales bacterium]MDD4634367.1 hypothetical protein [Bacteroidales bacterium]